MSTITTINMATFVAPIISSRDVMSAVREEVERQSQSTFAEVSADRPVVQLDFADVQFISRSAAHELLQMKEQLANKDPKIQVEFQNTSGDVAKMLRVVASNRAVPKEPTESADIKAVSIDELTHDKSTTLGFFRRLFAQ